MYDIMKFQAYRPPILNNTKGTTCLRRLTRHWFIGASLLSPLALLLDSVVDSAQH